MTLQLFPAERHPVDPNLCFVIMPFGKKPVGDHDVDFDWIYDTIFVPAINAANMVRSDLAVRRSPQLSAS